MVRDAETGEMLTLGDLWEIGYAVGLLLRQRADLLDGIEGEPSEGDMASLTDGYEAGIRETESELAQRQQRFAAYLEVNAEALRQGPVCNDETPF